MLGGAPPPIMFVWKLTEVTGQVETELVIVPIRKTGLLVGSMLNY